MGENSDQGWSETQKLEMVENILLEEERELDLEILEECQGYGQKLDQLVPIEVVPAAGCLNQQCYNRVISVNSLNEQNIRAGRFGWCFLCRKSANLYCKETRVPVCSVTCKISHLRMIKYIQLLQKEIEDNDSGPQSILEDLSLVTRYLCRLGFNDSSMNEFKEKSAIKDVKDWEKQFKTYIFELILMILDKSGISLQQNEGFRSVVRKDLCEGLIRNCVSVHENIFKLSASIFLKMVESFKFGIKNEIAVFIEDIFIKILESSTSAYQQKLSSLLVLIH